ncbi:MAG: hypothetical protein DRH06_10900 [Deltaproteobacteria bacterium]|nr:MAG: hypothetical protein DRH06_10900 [Deltaproteobacteria bacterium]
MMRKFRICIGSNDGDIMAETHMGDTRTFYCYDLFDSTDSLFVDERVNHAIDMEHAQSDKMKSIVALLEDVDVFVAQQKSPNFIKIAKQTRYQPVVVFVEKISDILALLQSDFEKIYSLVERRRSGEFFDTIPELSADV